jgi:SAM-dependent methyltransferase
MELPEWAPEGVQVDRPSAARIYDYLLGGFHNFAADREVARLAIEAKPDVPVQARVNRAFLHRAVRHVLSQGVDQFLDLGSGIPTLGNVHDIARQDHPEARVVYVDIDPVAVAHSRHVLVGNERVTAVQADLRRPLEIVADPAVQAVIDFSRPVAVLLVAVLHAVPDRDKPGQVLAELRDALAPGSFLVIAHGTQDSRPEESVRLAEISQRTTTPLSLRTHAEILALFDGFELVEPGLVWAPLWRPESPHQVPEHPEMSSNLAGVGRRL